MPPMASRIPRSASLSVDLARRLDVVVAEAQRQWRAPGVSVGLVRDGSLVYSRHVGAARLDPLAPADDNTQFMMGSITKTFTAVLIMQLRDAGTVSYTHLTLPTNREV